MDDEQGSTAAGPKTPATKFVAAIFEASEAAEEAEQAILSLKRQGILSISGMAVVGSSAAGKLSIIKAPEGPSTEALQSLLSELCAAVSALPPPGLGLLTDLGSWGDLVDFGVTPHFTETLAKALRPGRAAVIAEIEEDWITPLDKRVEEIGGGIMRTWRSDFEAESHSQK